MLLFWLAIALFFAVWWYRKGKKGSRTREPTQSAITNSFVTKFYEDTWQNVIQCIRNKPETPDRQIAADFMETWSDIYASGIVTPIIWYKLHQRAMRDDHLLQAMYRLGCQ